MATTAVLNLGLNTSEFNRGLRRSEQSLSGFRQSTISTATIIKGILAGAATSASLKMIKLASDAEETASKFEAVFKGIERESDTIARSFSKNFGVADSTARELLSSTGDLLTGFGFTGGEALKLSFNVNKLASDLASFQNLQGGTKRASEALTKALLGETESAKSLGIVIRQNSKEFKDQVQRIRETTGATEQQAKTQAIWLQIQEQSKNALGDTEKTWDSTANKMKRVSEQWKGIQEQTGRFLIDGLQVDNVLEGLSRGMQILSNNAHNVAFAINGITSELAGFIAKSIIITKGELSEFGDAFDVIKAKIKGDDAEVNRIRNRVAFQRKLRESEIDSVNKYTIKKQDEAFKEWQKIEIKKTQITKKNVDTAIADAIEKTKDLGLADGKKSDTKTKSSQQRINDALLKGSIEAQRAEQTQEGNKTEKKIKDENIKQTKLQRDLVSSVSSMNVVNIV
jgi:hypothetical protein